MPKGKPDYNLVKDAASISMEIMRKLYDSVEVGVAHSEIDNLAFDLCDKYQVRPAFYNVQVGNNKYPSALCISVNDAVLHGLPAKGAKFSPGDVVKLDFGVVYRGHFTDFCVTFGLNPVAETDVALIKVAKLAVLSAAKKAQAGVFTGDLGNTMETIAETAGYSVLTGYVGHGIGTSLWEQPQIPAYGNSGEGDALVSGAVICVEAQVVAGSPNVYIDKDRWTVRTQDGSNGAMFEYMLIVNDGQPEILTDTSEWPVVK